jgi:hypothetical protein
VQEKKNAEKEPKWLRFRKSIYPSKIFSHRNLLVYPTRGAGKKKNVEKEPCPMGSDEIHEILSIKSHEIQWDLMRFMRVLSIKSYEIQWDLMRFMRVLSIKSYEIQWDLMRFMKVLSIKSRVAYY